MDKRSQIPDMSGPGTLLNKGFGKQKIKVKSLAHEPVFRRRLDIWYPGIKTDIKLCTTSSNKDSTIYPMLFYKYKEVFPAATIAEGLTEGRYWWWIETKDAKYPAKAQGRFLQQKTSLH